LDSNILFAGTSSGLYYSENQGKNWKKCSNFNNKILFTKRDNYQSIAISKNTLSKLIVGTNKGEIYKSNNSGKSWLKIGLFLPNRESNLPITVLKLIDNESGFYFVVGDSLYFYSFIKKDLKLLLNSKNKITDFYMTKDVEPKMYIAGSKSLYYSSDMGNSWLSSAKIPNGNVYRIVLNPSNHIIALWKKNWQGGILISNDMGNTWKEISQIRFDMDLNPTRRWKNNGDRFVSIKMSPLDNNVLFSTSDWGVFKSVNGGYSWKESIRGAANSVGSDIHITSNGSIFVATMDNGLLVKHGKQKIFNAIFPRDSYREEENGHIWRVISNPYDPDNIIATSSPWNEKVNQIIISHNGGKSFSISKKGLPSKRPKINTIWDEGYPRAIAMDPTNPQKIYLGIDGDDNGGLYISSNGGQSWSPSIGQPDSKKIYNALAVDPINPKRIYWGSIGEKGGVYVSNDAGLTWTHSLKLMKSVFDMKIDKNNWVYAVGSHDGPIGFISKNHGKTWTPLGKIDAQGTAESLAIHPDNPNILYLSTVKWNGKSQGKVFKSQDAGKTWIDISDNLPNGSGSSAMTFSKDGKYLYMLPYSGSVFKRKIVQTVN
jgi:photosystem II stability/assembly factor-like uncharacterized protein